MTVSTTQVRVSYTGDGTTVAFPIPFPFYLASDLMLLLGGSQISTGFSISGGGSGTPLVPGTGAATMATAPAAGVNLQIVLNDPLTQLVNLVDGIEFPSATLNQVNDRAVQLAQRLNDILSRSIRAPDGDISPSLQLPAASVRANLAPIFDANGNIALGAIPTVAFTQAIFNAFLELAPLFLQTESESLISVTPTNFGYLPGNVIRYGATGAGVADDSGAFQTAFNVAKVAGGTVYIPAPGAYYLVQASLDLTMAPGASYAASYTVRMEANQHFSANSPNGGILAQHTGHVFDCTGAFGLRFYGVCVASQQTTQPQTVFFLARNSSEDSAGIHRFRDCMVFGYFSACVSYDYGSEDDIFDGCYFENYSTSGGFGGQAPKVYAWTSSNIAGLSSTHTAIATGPQSTLHHQVNGGNAANAGALSQSDVFYYEGVGFVELLRCWAACEGGRSIIYVDPSNQPSSNCTVYDVEIENGAAPANGVDLASATAAQTPVDWTVDASYFAQVAAVIAAGSNITCSGFRLRGLSSGGAGMSITALSYSTVDCDAMPLSITSAQNCTFIGSRAAPWAITTRTACKFIDTSPVTSRVPVLSASSFGGTGVTISSAEYNDDGTTCDITFEVQATGGNLTYAAGTAITVTIGGVLEEPSRAPGEVKVYDATAQTVISGGGWCDGNGIHLSDAITSTSHVYAINARFFVG